VPLRLVGSEMCIRDRALTTAGSFVPEGIVNFPSASAVIMTSALLPDGNGWIPIDAFDMAAPIAALPALVANTALEPLLAPLVPPPPPHPANAKIEITIRLLKFIST
jgi:hypothetical protein